MPCNNNSGPNPGIIGECPPLFIGCINVTDGEPTVIPETDQLPIYIDPDTGCIWLYVCDDVGWFSVCGGTDLCELTPVDIGVVEDICESLNIPVTYEIDGDCVQGTITLQMLAEEIGNCINIDDCCYQPFIDEGRAGTFVRSRCFRIGPGANEGVQIIDSLNSDFEASPGGIPMDWSYTNTTNQQGVLKIHGTMWVERFQPTALVPARVLFMLGREDRVKFYPLNTPFAAGTQASTPHFDEFVSYDTRRFPNEPIYAFWGNWISGLCPACTPNMGTDADVSQEFVLEPGETIDLSARIAVGYASPVAGSDPNLESGWMGVRIRYVFQGSNQIT